MNDKNIRDFRAMVLKDYGLDISNENELLPLLLMQYDLHTKYASELKFHQQAISTNVQKLESILSTLKRNQKQNVFYGDSAKFYRPLLWPVVVICVTTILLFMYFSFFKDAHIENLNKKIQLQEQQIEQLTKGKNEKLR